MDAVDPVTFDPVRDYDALANALALGTKRNPRRAQRRRWEQHLDRASVALLHQQQDAVCELEILYENLQSSAILGQLTKAKVDLVRLTT